MKTCNGILDQIKSYYTYKDTLTTNKLYALLYEVFASPPKIKDYIWCCINTITYSGTTLAEIRSNKITASKNAISVKEIQGFKPKLKFKYAKDNRRKNRTYRC